MEAIVKDLKYDFVNGTTLAFPAEDSKPFETSLSEAVTGGIQSFFYPKSITNLAESSENYFLPPTKTESPSHKLIALLEGEVEEIENNFGLVSIEKNGVFEERIFSLDRLKNINANYVGAKLIISITEEKNSIITTIEKSSEEKPLWASPDEEVIRLLHDLKKNK